MGIFAVIIALTGFFCIAAEQINLSAACPNFADYARRIHRPLSRGTSGLPFQRPVELCRSFVSETVDAKVEDMKSRLRNKDIARLFENCLPNTLDTTVRWHDPDLPATFVITGDISAMWLRDSTFQLQPYLQFLDDLKLQRLVNGAIQTQALYIKQSRYCNAFQPPRLSGLRRSENNQEDTVFPTYDPDVVFECKYEIDSLSSFLRLSRQYFEQTEDYSMFTEDWIQAVQSVLRVVQEQSQSSYDPVTHLWNRPHYTFKRRTDSATETLSLGGAGYPVNANTSLVRSAFRPSDDSTILQFFIPGNAMLSTELAHLSKLLEVAHSKGVEGARSWANLCTVLARSIREAIYKHGTFEHPEFGLVFAYEVDGYGGRIFMDDANMPSLLALPLIGFLSQEDRVYQNTRKMVLSTMSNPYFLKGSSIQAIGSPHTPTKNVWPMSLLVQIMTSNDKTEIASCLEAVVSSTADLGLMHESVNAWRTTDYTRPWFAWANALFATTILDLEKRFPELLFN
ncbi:Meiotically up-regulated gene 157 protein [Taphrina deformans PYCC 5710]|uniref:Meiotically up-regulated gene 157 protein n=1 Tax=Taphrina deformans (strain PYCC 5710 / ATCC 11124 / CBS 356.35 / IMI 108563 / JCM 9778 / NBRC 8474) TaxID=1097556 RepID=R4XBH6_TAPDE|nr:Meiotically up-regulated gene 157 protein [Taphrina deformans PYCC 5710]|eukprot:CCG83128.1 Meiotically up-regulated gene 157 protein [Taphrina deformans PYCC 5710]